MATAIESSGVGTTEAITIQQSDLIDNVYGIVINDFDNVSINRNAINIGDAGYTLYWPIGIGVQTDHSTGYLIEENTITTTLTQGIPMGINISDSGTDDNRVYKITLAFLNIASGGNGTNRNAIGSKGLQFLCNNFQRN